MDLPAEVEGVFAEFRTAEFATVARDGFPLAVQLSPLWQPAKDGFLITTGIGFPHKAYHARRYPRVSLLFSDPTGSGLARPPAVLVQCDATVSSLTTWDDDLAEFWPWIFARQPKSGTVAMRLAYRYVMPWYFQRLKIHLVPRRIRFWPGLDMSEAGREIPLPGGPGPATSPPAAADGPAGRVSTAAFGRLARATERFPVPRLTVLQPSGYPASVLCPAEVLAGEGVLRLRVPSWLSPRPGPASLMSHRHDEELWHLAGYLSRGTLRPDGGGWLFQPASFASFGGSGPAGQLALIRDTRRAARAYLQRRGTPPPPIPWDKLTAAKKAARAGLRRAPGRQRRVRRRSAPLRAPVTDRGRPHSFRMMGIL